MRKTFKIIVFGLASIVISSTNIDPAAAANEFLLSDTLKKGLKKTKNILEDIEHARKVIEDVKNKRSPTPKSGLWKDFVSEANRTASDLKSAPLPTRFDSKPYQVSFEEFQKCKNRKFSIQKLNGHLTELKAAIDRGKSVQQEFSDIEIKIKEAHQSIAELSKVYEDLAKTTQGVQALSHHFAWNWFDLNTNVPQALAILAMRLKIKKGQLSKT